MAGIPLLPLTAVPTTMLLRLVVVPLRLLIVVLPLVVLPARLKVSGLLVCAVVGVADRVTVVAVNEETVVADAVGMPELVLVTTIPTATPEVLATVTVLLVVVQVPVVVNIVGSVNGVLRVPLVGPTASEFPVKVKVAAEEITIDEPLTLLTVAPVGMPCPYMYIPDWIAAVPETEPLGVSIETLEIVLLALLVLPMIGITGMILPRRSVKSPPVVAMPLQRVALVHSALPTLTVVT